MQVSLYEREWLESHAVCDKHGRWFCKSTKHLLKVFRAPRLVQSAGLFGGVVSIIFTEQFLCPMYGHGRISGNILTIHEHHVVEM